MLCFPQVQQRESWPDLHTELVPTQPLSKPHVHKRSTFLERSKELLHVEDLKQPIIMENYKEMFHKLLCWEEKEHITLLHQRLVSWRVGIGNLCSYMRMGKAVFLSVIEQNSWKC